MNSIQLVPIKLRQKTAIEIELLSKGNFLISHDLMCSFELSRSKEWIVGIIFLAFKISSSCPSPHPRSIRLLFKGLIIIEGKTAKSRQNWIKSGKIG